MSTRERPLWAPETESVSLCCLPTPWEMSPSSSGLSGRELWNPGTPAAGRAQGIAVDSVLGQRAAGPWRGDTAGETRWFIVGSGAHMSERPLLPLGKAGLMSIGVSSVGRRSC